MAEKTPMPGDKKRVFGIRFPPSDSTEALAKLSRETEEGGFDWIWGLDTPLMAGTLFDPYVDLVVVAQNTKHALIGPAVSPLYLRSPVATAAAILSLDRISNGRAVLGMGSGGSALATLGVQKEAGSSYISGAAARQAQLADEVAFMRKLFNGEPVSLGTREIHLDPSIRPVPIYLAASGPKMLELAGKIADGVMIHVGIWGPGLKEAIGHVRRGAEMAGKDPDSVDIVCYTITSISAEGDRKRDIRHVKPVMSFWYTSLPGLLEKAGIDVSVRKPAKMPYPDMTHAHDWNEAMDAADSYMSDEAAEKFCLVGPPERAIERIEEMFDAGVNQVYVRGSSSYGLPYDLVPIFAEKIIPHFRKKG